MTPTPPAAACSEPELPAGYPSPRRRSAQDLGESCPSRATVAVGRRPAVEQAARTPLRTHSPQHANAARLGPKLTFAASRSRSSSLFAHDARVPHGAHAHRARSLGVHLEGPQTASNRLPHCPCPSMCPPPFGGASYPSAPFATFPTGVHPRRATSSCQRWVRATRFRCRCAPRASASTIL